MVAEEETTESEVTTGIEKETLHSIMKVVVENAGTKGVKLRDLPRAVDTVIKTWPNLTERKNLLTNKTDIIDEMIGQNFLTSKQDVFNYEDDLVTTA